MKKFELSQGNSSANQGVKGKFVSCEVYCHIGSLVEKIIENDFEFYNEFENISFLKADLSDEEFEGSEKDRDEKINELEDVIVNQYGDDEKLTSKQEEELKTIGEDIRALQYAEYENQEILEYWAVSGSLLEKLKALGQPVTEYGLTSIWGRCTSGQAILLDYSITKICADMEILEHQANSWAEDDRAIYFIHKDGEEEGKLTSINTLRFYNPDMTKFHNPDMDDEQVRELKDLRIGESTRFEKAEITRKFI